MVRAIVGANWGDEGKGKITDMLAKESDIIIRFQGGSNAGHTIINNYGRFALHLLPSGVFYDHTTSIIGNGVALNIPYLINEINDLISKGVPKPRILVSDRAQILMPYHVQFDAYEEERLGGKSFGSTKSGIAPFYSDKYAKIGFQVSELFDADSLREKISRVCETKNVLLEHLYHKPLLDPEELFAEMLKYKEMVEPYVCDVSAYLYEALKEGKNILLEGQLGSLKDPDHGIYPMVTSSSTLAAYGAIGAGIPPYEIKNITTVVKAYSSAVGQGAFVSELFGEEADELRRRGGDKGEFGATTGRPRRVGWFDAVASRYGCRIQGTTEAVLTVLDVLGYLDELTICTGYEIDGEIVKDFPVTCKLEKAKPVYKKMPGWKCDIRGIRNYNELPAECRAYIEEIGFQVSELFDADSLREKISRVCETKNVLLEHLYHKPLLDPEELFAEMLKYKEMVEPYVCDVSAYLYEALKEGKNILLEGQLGSLKDPDHGIYPMVTSSSTLAAYGAIGAGIPPYEIKNITTVVKAYSSAVGQGAFVSELFGEEADELRRRGGDKGEFGATTGRPRRVGWFDAVASRYGCRIQGTTEAVLTVLDVLGYLDELTICTGYEIDGEIVKDFPVTCKLEKAKPVYKKMPGWKCDIRGIRNYNELPAECRAYIEEIEKEIGVPITMVSNGPGRDEIIMRK